MEFGINSVEGNKFFEELLKKYQKEFDIGSVKVKADTKVPAATAFIDTDFASIDLDLEKQFEEIEIKLRECAEDRKILFRADK